MTAEVQIRLDPEERRVWAWLGDKQIAGVTVEPIDFDWGRGTIVPMGGVAAVGTGEEHRRQGIAGRVMRRAVEFSREQGYPVGGVSTGYGNVARRLYTRGGYVYLFSVGQYEKAVARPEPAPPPGGVEVRPYRPGDEKGIIELWNRSYPAKDFFGGRPADASTWVARRIELLTTDPHSVWVAVRDGTVVGWGEYYFHWGKRERCAFLVDEDADGPDVARALLTRLERSLADAGLTQFVFDASRHQVQTRNSLLEAGCQRADGYVFHVAVFNLSELLNRLQPLYAKRLRGSQLDSWPGILQVDMGGQTAEVELPGGDAGNRVEMAGPYETVVRVLCGRSSAWQEYLRGRLRIAGDLDPSANAVLDAFLGQYPWFHPRRDQW